MSQPIEVDEPGTSEYSTQGEQPRTSTEPEARSDESRSIKSVAPAILENGRFYCNETYLMPCDDIEQTRLSILYQTYLSLLDNQISLGLIPRSPKRILEIGTGLGDWAIAVAERFPNAAVIATDISTALHPGAAPPNVTFEIDDAQDEWTYNEPFDFIHIRELGGAFSDWGMIYGEVSKHLKIGGSVEIADHGRVTLMNEPENSYTSIFNGALESAAEKARRPLNMDHLKKPAFEAAHLTVTKSKTFDLPVGDWSEDPRKKLAGKMALIAVLEGLEAVGLRLLTKYQGWKEAEVREVIEKVKEEIMRPDVKAFIRVQFVVARKMGI
ncbi:uncharacterized protein KY384_003855 [Bacidia gigantensis]|uniref:uncharacterized protein n=1 Tax=Bacidia gigantensis TaxID=2732470 RepID=UPI001D036D68|nr:uncharacterized protein KY384_003855 [Bacidia gigantensis]KAG8532214.1 hypothetical protein KY384_003855 [Bacidia gigantensis]